VRPFLPGSTLGILGGGQLGRMLALAARRMGYRVVTLDPSPDSPCGQVADEQITAAYDNPSALRRLGKKCDVVTYEFENIPAASVKRLERAGVPVRPGSRVLEITQNRLAEKRFLNRIGVPTVPFHEVRTSADAERATRLTGFPAVIKSAGGGYDGKGQAVVRNRAAAQAALSVIKARPLIWEGWADFEKELGVLCVRSLTGEVATYPVSENVHQDNILYTTAVPALISPRKAAEARRMAEKIARALDIVGLFCVEFFLLKDGRLLVNEIAPRPHNSGHYTIDACECSQFEQQLRAVCGLPLGSTRLTTKAAAMVNLLGEGKGDRLAGVEKILVHREISFHLYGKTEAKAKRKMGHITVRRESVKSALALAKLARKRLEWVR